jgi:hypothetical protein
MREYILITVPGDLTTTVFRPAFERDHIRFPKQYLAFKAGQEQIQGTPLTSVSWLNPAQCDELAYFRIQTVEQLASVSDVNAQRYMGLNDLRSKAQRHMEIIKAEAPMNKLQAELASRDETIAALQAQMKELMEFVRANQKAEQGGQAPEPPNPPIDRERERAELDA